MGLLSLFTGIHDSNNLISFKKTKDLWFKLTKQRRSIYKL